MVSKFYRRYSLYVLAGLALLAAPLFLLALALPTNNSIETWLPSDAEVVARYDRLKKVFGVDEFVVVALEDRAPEDPLLEGLAQRFEQIEIEVSDKAVHAIRQCWTPGRMKQRMLSLGVPNDEPDHEADRRLRTLLVSQDGKMSAILAVLTTDGQRDRHATMNAIHEELDAVGLGSESDKVHLAGPPVVSTTLDRWGGMETSRNFFVFTLAVCFISTAITLRSWRLAIGINLLMIWGVLLTQALVQVAGGEMNFIMTALPPMVLVLSVGMAVHFVHYHRWSLGQEDPLRRAFKMAWLPCLMACVTTVLGMVSLVVSEMAPVREYGLAAAVGSIVSLLVGLGLVPALLVVMPEERRQALESHQLSQRFAAWVVRRPGQLLFASLALILATGYGLSRLESDINPIEFVPQGSKLARDYLVLEERLNGMAPIEAVVDFGEGPGDFYERLARVRKLQEAIQTELQARYGDRPLSTASLATFFPDPLPTGVAAIAAKLATDQDSSRNNYVTDDLRLWRITAWVPARGRWMFGDLLRNLQAKSGDLSVEYTGIVPLLDYAQQDIFRGFWQSFATAFLVIGVVMAISLRSVVAGILALVPNVASVVVVFGLVAWSGIAVDIGTMMTASIALGIAVDGALHFMGRYRSHCEAGLSIPRAVEQTVIQCGQPIVKSAIITGLGLLVLVVSHFTPMVRFGWFMASLLAASTLGNLVLLPVLLLVVSGKSGRHGPRWARPSARPASVSARPAYEPRFPKAHDLQKKT